MSKKEPNIVIDRKVSGRKGKITITIRNEFSSDTFTIPETLLETCYKALDISNDIGGLNRMKEVVEWFAEYEKENDLIIEKK